MDREGEREPRESASVRDELGVLGPQRDPVRVAHGARGVSTLIASGRPRRSGAPWPVLAMIAAGWTLAIVAELTGTAGKLHHDALIEHGPPLWLGFLLFLLAWQAMLAAMMLPSS